MRAFRNYLRQRQYAPRTVEGYARMIRRLERWLETEDRPALRQAHPRDLSAFAATIPHTHASRTGLRSALSAYWAFLGRKDPPLWAIPNPKAPQMVCRALEDDELERVLKVAREWPDVRVWAMVALLYFAALRRAEAVELRWADVDFETGDLHVVGKGGQEAFLPMHGEIRSALAELGEQRDEDGVYVFAGRFPGTHLALNTVNVWVKLVGAAAGLEGDLSPHLLRHSSLAVANDETGNLRAVQSFARHRDPRTTAGYTRTQRRALMEILDALGGHPDGGRGEAAS